MGKSLKTMTVVITGATSGIGFALMKLLNQRGVLLIGVGRSNQRNKAAKEKLRSENPAGDIVYLNADLAQTEMVHNLAEDVQQCLYQRGESHLDILINCAGIYMERKQNTVDGIEKTFAVNHLAQFRLTYYLQDLLANSDRGKMISVSSYAHYNTPMNLYRISNPAPYIGLLAYKRSKLCNVLFVRELSKKTDRFAAYAADPGLVNTEIGSKSGKGISALIWSRHRRSGMVPETSAANLLDILTNENITPSGGVYIKDREEVQPSRNARNDDLAARLWDLSCKLTQLDWC